MGKTTNALKKYGCFYRIKKKALQLFEQVRNNIYTANYYWCRYLSCDGN